MVPGSWSFWECQHRLGKVRNGGEVRLNSRSVQTYSVRGRKGLGCGTGKLSHGHMRSGDRSQKDQDLSVANGKIRNKARHMTGIGTIQKITISRLSVGRQRTEVYLRMRRRTGLISLTTTPRRRHTVHNAADNAFKKSSSPYETCAVLSTKTANVSHNGLDVGHYDWDVVYASDKQEQPAFSSQRCDSHIVAKSGRWMKLYVLVLTFLSGVTPSM